MKPPFLDTTAVACLRRHGWFLVLLGLLAPVYLWLNVHSGLGSIGGDGLIYFLTAWDYAAWAPRDPLAVATAEATLFPPVYPLLLMASGAIYDFWPAHLLTTLFLLGGFAGCYAWALGIGLTPLRATACAALFALLPGTFLQSFYLHPEGLYVALVFAALALLEAGERSGRPACFWWATVAIAVAFITRTVGVTLLPALAVAVYRCRPPGWFAMPVLAAVPALAWAVFHHPDKTYSSVLLEHFNPGLPLQTMLGKVAHFVVAAFDGLAWNLVQVETLRAIGLAACVLAMVVAAWRFIRGKADAWYVLAYSGVLAVWPYTQEAWRLTWVIVPLLLGYLVWAGDELRRLLPALSGPARTALAAGPLLGLALVVVPGAILTAQRVATAYEIGEPELRHVPQWYEADLAKAYHMARLQFETLLALRSFASRVEDGECIYSVTPLVTAYYTNRRSASPPTDGPDFEEELKQWNCRYVLAFARPSRRYPVPYYPRDRFRDTVEVVAEHRMPGAAVDAPPEIQLLVRRPP